jgi:chemotaxis response regulator CheB
MELGRLRDALLDYDEAIQIYPSLAEAYASRAVVRVLLGMNAEAEQDVLRAEELGVHAGAPDQARDEVRSAP